MLATMSARLGLVSWLYKTSILSQAALKYHGSAGPCWLEGSDSVEALTCEDDIEGLGFTFASNIYSAALEQMIVNIEADFDCQMQKITAGGCHST